MDRFRTTRWTVIRSARAKDEPGSEVALATLCESYWYPLYVFVRRSGHDAESASDLTQGYFLKLMEKDFLKSVDPASGKFRSFLLASMKHFLANDRRDAAALKRGGGVAPLSLDVDDAEARYAHEAAEEDSPDRAYEKRWAWAVIERAHQRLRERYRSRDQERVYELLAGHLTGVQQEKSHREIADELESSEAAVKMKLSRLRRQFGTALREEIADTVDDEAQIDDEVKYLLHAL